MTTTTTYSKRPVVWTGTAPDKCELCYHAINGTFIDGRTALGWWANMCPACHEKYGVGLGLGRGQRYEKQDDGKYTKVEGVP